MNEIKLAQGAPSIIRGHPLSEEPGLGPLTLPGMLRDVAFRHAEREGLVMHRPDGAVTRWTYAQLWDRTMEVARALLACGVGKGSRIGVLMTNRPEWIATVFGVSLAGGVAIALSTFSTEAELEFLLKASDISVLLFERAVLKKDFEAMLLKLEPGLETARPGHVASPQFPFLRHVAKLDDERPRGAIETWPQFLARGEAVAPALVEAASATVKPSEAALLFFSSGTTGRPKGVFNSHRGVCIQCWRWARLYSFGPEVRGWSPNGFFWSGNFAIGLGAVMAAGGCIVIQRIFEPAESIALLEKERVTFAYAWPHQWAQLEAVPNWDGADLSSLHYFEPGLQLRRPQASIRTEWREPRASYGNTETFTIVTGTPANLPPEATQGHHGEALAGCTIKVVDPLSGEILPRGESGEIAVKGPTLMLGYLGVPLDETLDEQGFLRTGDGGYIDEQGRLVFQGRLNDIIKTGGANVSPVEVDNVLGALRGVKVCKTVGVPHETLGEMVVSCVAPEAERPLTEAQVRDYLRARLASYKVPRRVVFVSETELDFTGSAKVKADGVRALVAKRLRAEEGAA
ncbi:class I adenylate-forming enzyme family protein [Phenylobacterium sp. LjRoot225]|uniref:class I adenylate-forming enzyme family protein n=1 Tax=Phenylobacterium sp. LjRoot225 TaxID=3342285 RepID=UPI003ECD2D08